MAPKSFTSAICAGNSASGLLASCIIMRVMIAPTPSGSDSPLHGIDGGSANLRMLLRSISRPSRCETSHALAPVISPADEVDSAMILAFPLQYREYPGVLLCSAS